MASHEELDRVRPLIAWVRKDTLRTRIGVWQMPLEWIGQEKTVAAHLGVETVDMREIILGSLPEGTRFVHLTATKVQEVIDTIASTRGKTDCALVYNLDLLLAGLSSHERLEVWRSLIDGYPHRARALVIAIPEGAISQLWGHRVVEALENDGRLV